MYMWSVVKQAAYFYSRAHADETDKTDKTERTDNGVSIAQVCVDIVLVSV